MRSYAYLFRIKSYSIQWGLLWDKCPYYCSWISHWLTWNDIEYPFLFLHYIMMEQTQWGEIYFECTSFGYFSSGNNYFQFLFETLLQFLIFTYTCLSSMCLANAYGVQNWNPILYMSRKKNTHVGHRKKTLGKCCALPTKKPFLLTLLWYQASASALLLLAMSSYWALTSEMMLFRSRSLLLSIWRITLVSLTCDCTWASSCGNIRGAGWDHLVWYSVSHSAHPVLALEDPKKGGA